ncbi:hypothetical protein Y1Q_0014651 [Alligator mississippiensis]|uniref:Uncharacterized protein n=1 Tax=Alligator mississippiensis TaxID=8496 RepID=A0A151P8W7_ALLMI|nr:hypothetical protein Y1Q_0014651 [Alligator mississippiensis]
MVQVLRIIQAAVGSESGLFSSQNTLTTKIFLLLLLLTRKTFLDYPFTEFAAVTSSWAINERKKVQNGGKLLGCSSHSRL